MTYEQWATFGVLGFLRLGIDRYPEMEFPFVGVVTTLNGASPSTMEDEVADVLEEVEATAGELGDNCRGYRQWFGNYECR